MTHWKNKSFPSASSTTWAIFCVWKQEGSHAYVIQQLLCKQWLITKVYGLALPVTPGSLNAPAPGKLSTGTAWSVFSGLNWAQTLMVCFLLDWNSLILLAAFQRQVLCRVLARLLNDKVFGNVSNNNNNNNNSNNKQISYFHSWIWK